MKKIIIILAIIFIISSDVGAFEIDFIKKIPLSQKALLQMPLGFSVTEDEVFIIVDARASDIKIYNCDGKLAKVLGRKGYGPNEFANAFFCHYSDRKLIIEDSGQMKIFIYDRQGKFEFIRSKSINSTETGEDFHLEGNTLYLSGSRISQNGNVYSLYALDTNKPDHCTYFLPAHLKFGLATPQKYRFELHRKVDISAIGTSGYFDVTGDFAYYFWEGDLKIFKINLKTRKASTFGKKFDHYIKPYATQKIKQSFSVNRAKTLIKERNKMSYVKNLFTTDRYVLLFYTARGQNHEDLGYRMQFYTLEGTFLKELPFPKRPGSRMYFDKDKSTLYTIKWEADKELDETYSILKYRVKGQ
jgi:6-bladed beta-propeller